MNINIKELSNDLQSHGFVKIKNFYDSIYVAQLIDKLEFYYEPELNLNGLPERDKDDKRIFNLVEKDYEFIRLISNPNILEIIKPGIQDLYYRWIDQSLCNFIIRSCSARSSGSYLDLHIDSGIPFCGEYPLGYVVVTCLEESTIENGCTFIVKKTHQSGRYSDRGKNIIKTAIEMSPGDILVLDSRLWHGALENHIKKSRWTINTHYSRWFIKQDVDIPKTISQAIYKKCTNQEKILLGFCSIPTNDVKKRINIKTGIEDIKNIVDEYFKK